jgi:hypothetical protein
MMDNASLNMRFAMEPLSVLMVQMSTTTLASPDRVERITSATTEDAFQTGGSVTLTTTVKTAVTSVPKFAIQTVMHALEPDSLATMDNALTTDGSVMEIWTAVMGLMRIPSCVPRGHLADQASFTARMATAFQSLGFAMVTMTAVTCLTRQTAHPPVVVVPTGLGVTITGPAFLQSTGATDKLSTVPMVRMKLTAPA